MSVSVNQILNDAKKLVSRLRENDNTTDTVISQTQTLYKNVDAMREYNEEVIERNFVNELRNRPAFEENSHIRDLRKENRALRDTLEEHQSALELLMSKYRQQVTQRLMRENAANGYVQASQELQRLAEDVCGLGDVMRKAIQADDFAHSKQQEWISQLVTENKGLRELLDISQTYGSLNIPLNQSSRMVDQESQTDDTSS